jgi:hypothetical protein
MKDNTREKKSNQRYAGCMWQAMGSRAGVSDICKG